MESEASIDWHHVLCEDSGCYRKAKRECLKLVDIVAQCKTQEMVMVRNSFQSCSRFSLCKHFNKEQNEMK